MFFAKDRWLECFLWFPKCWVASLCYLTSWWTKAYTGEIRSHQNPSSLWPISFTWRKALVELGAGGNGPVTEIMWRKTESGIRGSLRLRIWKPLAHVPACRYGWAPQHSLVRVCCLSTHARKGAPDWEMMVFVLLCVVSSHQTVVACCFVLLHSANSKQSRNSTSSLWCFYCRHRHHHHQL